MDEDLIALCAFMALLISFPVSVALITTSCIAYSRAKTWDKERNLKAANVETNRLVSSDESDSDFYDTDEEEEHNARKAEEVAERNFTFRQKWRKEFRNVWNGKGGKDILKQREREERRKLAKAVAKELERIERRRARKMMARGEVQVGESLPAYQKE